MSRTLLAVFALVAVGTGVGLASAGCDRTHLTPNYGVALRSGLSLQVVNRDAGLAPEVRKGGLDPEEAAIVNETYRKSLSPRGSDEAARRTPVLVVPSQPTAPPQQ